ncbi:hypothetical protein GC176_22955 [bacterium]|nr:hypothetical protein [bacterium]
MRRTTWHPQHIRVNHFRPQLAAALLFTGLLIFVRPAYAQNQNAGAAPAVRETPKEMRIEKELVTEKEVDDWRKKDRQQFSTDLFAGKLNSTTQPKIEKGVRILVHELSLKARRDTLTDTRKKILREIDPNAKGQQMREFVMSEIVKRAVELLDGNYLVRLHAVLLIGELNIDQGQYPRKPPIAYVQGAATLMDVIDPPQGGLVQPDAVRVLAARGIARLLREGRQTLPPNQKLTPDIARRVLDQLGRRNHEWYTSVLMDALIETALPTVVDAGNAPRPLIIEALARLMADVNQPYPVRTHAMYCLGRAPMPGGINAAPIAWAASQLAAQIATDINQGKVSGTRGFFLLQSIYFGYKPATPDELTTDGRGKAGLTNSLPSQSVQNAYRDFLPLFNGVIKIVEQGGRVIAAPQAIQTLRQVQQPPDMTLSPNGPSILKALTPGNMPPQAQNQANGPANAAVNPNAG